MAEYVFKLPSVKGVSRPKLVMDFIDVDSYKWSQYAEKCRLPMRWVYKEEGRRLLSYERRIAENFDSLLLVSELEKRLFDKVLPGFNATAMSNGVDLEFFSPGMGNPIEKKGPVVVFTGAMDYWPNVEGVCWFADEVLPEIRRRSPDLTFYIVGNRPAPEVQILNDRDGMVVTGFVDDVRDYLSAADVCVAPLRIARGIQNKVLEALAMGRPTVSTSFALEGVRAQHGREVLVADEPSAFAEAVVTLLEDRKGAEELGRRGRKSMETHFSWERNLSLLDEIVGG
jgi:sugar transferase (PEP-CTERM/EpsH1 system associated)